MLLQLALRVPVNQRSAVLVSREKQYQQRLEWLLLKIFHGLWLLGLMMVAGSRAMRSMDASASNMH